MSLQGDSNSRPERYKGSALPTELQRHIGGKSWNRTNIPGFSDPCRDQLGYLTLGVGQCYRTLVTVDSNTVPLNPSPRF